MPHAEPLSNADLAWLRMDQPTNRMVICGVMAFDGPLDRRDLERVIAERLLVFPRFRQRVVDRDGSPAWEDDPFFDLDAHVHRVALPAPGGQAELEELVADLLATPLDFETALWQVHLVDRFGEGSAIVTRIHHAIADGVALVRLLLSMTDRPSADSRARSAIEAHVSEGPLHALLRPAGAVAEGAVAAAEALFHEGVEILRHPGHALDLARGGIDLAQSISRLALLPADSETIFRGPLGVTKRVAWTGGISLEEVKDIGRRFGVTVNDVLLAAVTGSLRAYLEHRGRPVAGVELRILMPVDLRPADETGALGNHFGLVYLELPVGIDERLERLREVARRTRAIKASPDAAVAFGILGAIGMASAAIERQAIDLFSRKATAVVTNVPGPREKLRLAGRRLERMMFWVPQSGHVGLGFSILSYANEICIGVTADGRRVPDPGRLLTGVKEELAALAGPVPEG